MSNERKPMTDEELDAIHGRLTKATPGPWVHSQHGCYVILGYKPEKKRIDGYGADDHVCVLDDGDHHQYRSEDEQLANAALIAHAPTDIARLLAEVDRLREENKMLGAANEKLDFQRFLAEKRVQAMQAKGMEGKYVWQYNAENRWCPFNLDKLCRGIGCLAWIPKIDENGREYSDYGRCVRLIGEERNAERP